LEDSTSLLPGCVVLAGAGLGTWLLRRAWLDRAHTNRRLVSTGWALILLGLVWPAWVLGSARGPFVALSLTSLAALAVVAAGVKIRRGRKHTGRESLAPEPSDRATTRWRETLRWLLAGPIGMIAAMAVGIAYAALSSGEPQTRIVLGGLLVPLVWGAAMAWTLADDRILRACAVLVGIALAGFSIAYLKGFA